MLNSLIESIITGDDNDEEELSGKKDSNEVKKDKEDGLETVDDGNVGIDDEKGEELEYQTEKKKKEFCSEMEDKVKTLFIRIARSYGFLNPGHLSSKFVNDIRSSIESHSKQLSLK